jgi:hypothetical protein
MASTAAVQSPADAANIALVRMGYAKGRVGNLYDGSAAAKRFLDIYVQARDNLLISRDWDFAERNIALTLLKQAPAGGYIPPILWNPATNPPIGWLFEYAYPADCLKIRIVKAQPLFVPNFDPQPNQAVDSNDSNYNPPVRVVLSNVANAVMTYTGQVTDPTTWDVEFVELFATELAKVAAVALVGLEGAKAMMQVDAQETAIETGQG